MVASNLNMHVHSMDTKSNVTCKYCDRKAIKKNARDELICENRANHGRCSVPKFFEDKDYDGKKIQNNDPCPCGSGNKYKKCCK